MFKNSSIFKIFYYLSFIFAIGIFIFYIKLMVTSFSYNDTIYNNIVKMLSGSFYSEEPFHLRLLYVNIFLVICFTASLLFRKKIQNVNFLFPIFFLIYAIILIVIAVLFSEKVIFKNVQYQYYLTYIYGGYLFLNVYTLLSIEWKKEKVIVESIDPVQTLDINTSNNINIK